MTRRRPSDPIVRQFEAERLRPSREFGAADRIAADLDEIISILDRELKTFHGPPARMGELKGSRGNDNRE